MGQSLFPQNVIAVVWDFDKTLTPAYMQSPLFARYKVDEKTFWNEANGLAAFYKARGATNVSKDTLYLNHMLTYVRNGIFKGLTNHLLFELGRQIEFYPGMPTFLSETKDEVNTNVTARKYGITLEHYVVSTGLRKMIEGSAIAPFVDGIWACEFTEGTAQPGYLKPSQTKLFGQPVSPQITDIAYAIDNTTKTRALFEINKGCNKHEEIDVNATLSDKDRRIPFQNMLYIADGPSDVPAFSIMNKHNGHTFAVYKPKMPDQFEQVKKLQVENRVQGIGEADYTSGSLTTMWIRKTIEDMAHQIASNQQKAFRERVGSAPSHILTDIPSPKDIQEAVTSSSKKPRPKRLKMVDKLPSTKVTQSVMSDLVNDSLRPGIVSSTKVSA